MSKTDPAIPLESLYVVDQSLKWLLMTFILHDLFWSIETVDMVWNHPHNYVTYTAKEIFQIWLNSLLSCFWVNQMEVLVGTLSPLCLSQTQKSDIQNMKMHQYSDFEDGGSHMGSNVNEF